MALVVTVAARLIAATRTGFYNDDYVYLDAVARRDWLDGMLHPLSVGGYLRPFSRDLHFSIAQVFFGTEPSPYHWVNLTLVLASVALIWIVARQVCEWRGALLAASLFGLSHALAVLVGWVSGVQDLWALVWALASMAWFQRGRTALSAAAFVLALLSKESVALLPLVLVAIDPPGGTPNSRWKRCLPHFAILAAWAVWYASLRGTGRAFLWDAGAALALPWRFALAAVGVEGPSLWLGGLTQLPPSMALLGATIVVVVLWRLPGQPSGARGLLPWLLWTVLTWLPILAVAREWSAYYFALPLAGLSVAIGVASSSWPRVAVAPLPLVLLVSSQASLNVGLDSDRQLDDPSISQVSLGRLIRGDQFARAVGSQLRDMLPSAPDSALFLVSGAPANNGLFSGDGAGIRTLYRNPTLSACFRGQIDEGTGFHRPLFLLLWKEDSDQLVCAPIPPEHFAHLPRLLELDRHFNGAAAAADYEAAFLDKSPAAAWNAGYLHLQAGDTTSATRAWRESARRLSRGRAQPVAVTRLPSGPRTRYLELQRALYSSPLDTTLLVAAARAAAAFDTVTTANLYLRACYLAPQSATLLREAALAVHRNGPSAAASYLDSLLAQH